MNLDDLLGNLSPDQQNTPSKETASLEVSTTTSEQGGVTSTVIMKVETVRLLRKRFQTNLSDETLSAIIDRVQETTNPKIKDTTGEALEIELKYHIECARVFQNVLIEHSRVAIHSGLDPKASAKEIADWKKKRAEQNVAKSLKESTKEGRRKKREAVKIEQDKSALHEKLTRSTDAMDRAAGKFIKAQLSMGLFTEKQAVKMWNEMMKSNPKAMITNDAGVRLEEVMK